MKMYYRMILLSIMIFAISCRYRSNHCQGDTLETLFTDRNYDTTYVHYLLLSGIQRECMDKNFILKTVLNYLDTASTGKLTDVIFIFNSKDNFNFNEISQPYDIDKDCLIGINIKKGTHKLEDFLFYNERGDLVYEGPKWAKQDEDGNIIRLEVIPTYPNGEVRFTK